MDLCDTGYHRDYFSGAVGCKTLSQNRCPADNRDVFYPWDCLGVPDLYPHYHSLFRADLGARVARLESRNYVSKPLWQGDRD